MKLKISLVRKKDKQKDSFFRGISKAFWLSSLGVSSLFAFFAAFEPGLIKAVTDEVLVSLGITSEITLSAPSDVVLSDIAGMTGGSSTSSAISWTVVTNDTAGYTLKIEEDHLLRKGTGSNQTIANYTEAAAGTPDYNWGAVGAGNEEFGFAPSSGSDWVQKFKNATSTCNQSGGSITDSQCWSPIPITPATAETIAQTAAVTADGGSATAIKVKAEVGSGNHLEEGTFSCTITATATTN